MNVFVWSVFDQIGGACTEASDLVRFWRRQGVEVSVIQAGGMEAKCRRKLEELGCAVHLWPMQGRPPAIPGLAGSLVVGICELNFIKHSQHLREQNCRLVWMNTMTYIDAAEGLLYERAPLFDAYVFESNFQQSLLAADLLRFGLRAEQCYVIRAPFEFADWKFSPRPSRADEDFVVGRLARPDLAKWHQNFFDLLEQIKHPRRAALLLGIEDRQRGWLGAPRSWAQLLPPGAITPQEFYRRVHCLLPLSHFFIENWPRIGLEAMASGVPIVAPSEGGWTEMIEHRVTGMLAGNRDECVAFCSELAADEWLRMNLATQARERLHAELAEPNGIWDGWQRLFGNLC